MNGSSPETKAILKLHEIVSADQHGRYGRLAREAIELLGSAQQLQVTPQISDPQTLADTRSIIADEYEAGLRKMEAAGYEEFADAIMRHKVVIQALRGNAQSPADGIADFARRCQAYLDDAPLNGRHSDAAGADAYELIAEAACWLGFAITSGKQS